MELLQLGCEYNYLIPFIEIYKPIIQRYSFNIRSIGNEIIILNNDKFELEFTMWRETLELSYNSIISINQVLCYDIRDFIVSHMTADDRHGVESDSETIYSRNIRSLNYFCNAMNNHFSHLLAGNNTWFEDYKNSPYFSEARLMERKI